MKARRTFINGVSYKLQRFGTDRISYFDNRDDAYSAYREAYAAEPPTTTGWWGLYYRRKNRWELAHN